MKVGISKFSARTSLPVGCRIRDCAATAVNRGHGDDHAALPLGGKPRRRLCRFDAGGGIDLDNVEGRSDGIIARGLKVKMDFVADVYNDAAIDRGKVGRERPQVVAVRIEARIDADHGCHEGAHAHEILQIRIRRLKDNTVSCRAVCHT